MRPANGAATPARTIEETEADIAGTGPVEDVSALRLHSLRPARDGGTDRRLR